MIRRMFIRTVRATAAASFALAAGLALASGSDGGGSAETGDAAAYNAGKGVYATKLACAGCLMAHKSLDATTARELLAGKSGAALTPEESAVLEVYLKRRFKL